MEAAEKVNNPGKKLHLHRRLLKTLNKLINFPTFLCENKQPRKKEVMAGLFISWNFFVGIYLYSLPLCAWVIMNVNEFSHTHTLSYVRDVNLTFNEVMPKMKSIPCETP